MHCSFLGDNGPEDLILVAYLDASKEFDVVWL